MKKSVFFLLIMSLFVTNNAFSSGFNEEINIDQLEQLAKKEKVKKEKQPNANVMLRYRKTSIYLQHETLQKTLWI